MRNTLLGATGLVGSAILNEALNRGHTVSKAGTTAQRTQESEGGIYAPFSVAERRSVLLVALLATSACMKNSTENSAMTITPSRMQRVEAVDERYQLYDVEMLGVTGGRFWRPYSPEFEAILKRPAPGREIVH